MRQRVEAAAIALVNAQMARYGLPPKRLIEQASEHAQNEAVAALTAADAVMFSDEAVERAAEALCIKRYPMTQGFWAKVDPGFQQRCRDQARTVIAALKGDA